jgi:hypothetical protein
MKKYLVNYLDVYSSNTVMEILTKQELDNILASPKKFENVSYREVDTNDINKIKK